MDKEKKNITTYDVIMTHENTKWYRGECCSGYPNCEHKPLLASMPKDKEGMKWPEEKGKPGDAIPA